MGGSKGPSQKHQTLAGVDGKWVFTSRAGTAPETREKPQNRRSGVQTTEDKCPSGKSREGAGRSRPSRWVTSLQSLPLSAGALTWGQCRPDLSGLSSTTLGPLRPDGWSPRFTGKALNCDSVSLTPPGGVQTYQSLARTTWGPCYPPFKLFQT